jgi:hypothetical protein
MKLNRWQVKELKSWNGPLFDPQNTLRALYNEQPVKIRKSMVKLQTIYNGRSLESKLEEFGVKYVDSLSDFYYEIIASSKRNVQLIEARNMDDGSVIEDTDNNICAGASTAELVFGEDYFGLGEVIVGEKNEKYPLRIIGEPKTEGTHVVYTVEGWGLPNGMPGSELTAGKKFSPEYAPAPRGLSREQGTVRRPSTAKVRGMLSTIRIDHKVAGDVDDYAVVMGFPALDKEGKEVTFPVLSTWEDWLVEQEFSDYKNKAIKYGTTNVDAEGETYNIDERSGRKLTFGPGLRQQMEQSNTAYYNYFSLELLESVLEQLSYNKLKVSDRFFTIHTGQGGAKLFHKAVLNHTSGWTMLTDNNASVVNKTTSKMHDNALSAGFQFTEYHSANGIRVKVEVDDYYDDPNRNKILMPGTQLPAESYRMDIMWMGSASEPNVQKLGYSKFQKFGGELRGYGAGFRNPFTGEMNNSHMSYTEDSATITKFTHTGAVIYDSETTASLIPAVLQ